MRPKDSNNNTSGVAAGQPTVTTLSTNRRYFAVDMHPTGKSSAEGNPALTNPADIIGEVQIEVGSQLIRNVTADFLVRRAKFAKLGRVVPNNVIPIEFAEAERASVMDEQILAWETFGVEQFLIRTITKAGVVSPAISSICSYDTVQNKITSGANAGQTVRRIMRQDPMFWLAAGGVQNITDIKLSGRSLHRIFFDGVDITRVEIIADGVKVFDRLKAENDFDLARYGLDGTQFKFAAVFDEHGQVFDALNVSRDLIVKVYSVAGGNLSAIIESLSPDYV